MTADCLKDIGNMLIFSTDADLRHSGQTILSYADGHVAPSKTPPNFISTTVDLLTDLSGGPKAQGNTMSYGWTTIQNNMYGWTRTATYSTSTGWFTAAKYPTGPDFTKDQQCDAAGMGGPNGVWPVVCSYYNNTTYISSWGTPSMVPSAYKGACAYVYSDRNACKGYLTRDITPATLKGAAPGTYWAISGNLLLAWTGDHTNDNKVTVNATIGGTPTVIGTLRLYNHGWWSSGDWLKFNTTTLLNDTSAQGWTSSYNGKIVGATDPYGQYWQPFQIIVARNTIRMTYGNLSATAALTATLPQPTSVELFAEAGNYGAVTGIGTFQYGGQ